MDKKCVYNCSNGNGCYTFQQICDKRQNCADSSDEKLCGRRFCTNSYSSEPYFRCKSGYCIPSNLVNDGVADCKDGSDETYNNSYMTYALFVCSMIFLLLIFRWILTRRTPREVLANMPDFPLPPFRAPGEEDEISDSELQSGGEIYEAFARNKKLLEMQEETAKKKRSEVQVYRFQRASFDPVEADDSLVALASLSVDINSCIGLNRDDLPCFSGGDKSSQIEKQKRQSGINCLASSGDQRIGSSSSARNSSETCVNRASSLSSEINIGLATLMVSKNMGLSSGSCNKTNFGSRTEDDVNANSSLGNSGNNRTNLGIALERDQIINTSAEINPEESSNINRLSSEFAISNKSGVKRESILSSKTCISGEQIRSSSSESYKFTSDTGINDNSNVARRVPSSSQTNRLTSDGRINQTIRVPSTPSRFNRLSSDGGIGQTRSATIRVPSDGAISQKSAITLAPSTSSKTKRLSSDGRINPTSSATILVPSTSSKSNRLSFDGEVNETIRVPSTSSKSNRLSFDGEVNETIRVPSTSSKSSRLSSDGGVNATSRVPKTNRVSSDGGIREQYSGTILAPSTSSKTNRLSSEGGIGKKSHLRIIPSDGGIIQKSCAATVLVPSTPSKSNRLSSEGGIDKKSNLRIIPSISPAINISSHQISPEMTNSSNKISSEASIAGDQMRKSSSKTKRSSDAGMIRESNVGIRVSSDEDPSLDESTSRNRSRARIGVDGSPPGDQFLRKSGQNIESNVGIRVPSEAGVIEESTSGDDCSLKAKSGVNKLSSGDQIMVKSGKQLETWEIITQKQSNLNYEYINQNNPNFNPDVRLSKNTDIHEDLSQRTNRSQSNFDADILYQNNPLNFLRNSEYDDFDGQMTIHNKPFYFLRNSANEEFTSRNSRFYSPKNSGNEDFEVDILYPSLNPVYSFRESFKRHSEEFELELKKRQRCRSAPIFENEKVQEELAKPGVSGMNAGFQHDEVFFVKEVKPSKSLKEILGKKFGGKVARAKSEELKQGGRKGVDRRVKSSVLVCFTKRNRIDNLSWI